MHEDPSSSPKANASMSDDVLMDLLRRGDEAALRHIFLRYYERLCRFSYTIVQRKDLAEEAVANVFQTLWARHRILTIRKNLQTYLFIAVKNQSVDLVRFCRREPVSAIDSVGTHELPSEAPKRNSNQYEEVRREVDTLIQALPPQRRLVFRLNRFEGMRYRQIAEILGISERTVQNHMVLAMKQLAPELDRLKELIR